MNIATMRGEWHNAMGLLELIDYLPSHGSMVEIGCYTGESAAIFASRFQKLVCVDIWKPWIGIDEETIQKIEALFDKRMLGYDNVCKIKGASVDVASGLVPIENGSRDFLYIDAAHDEESVVADIKAWAPKIRSDGWIGGHDYVDAPWSGVIQAVKRCFMGEPVLFRDSSWLMRKECLL